MGLLTTLNSLSMHSVLPSYPNTSHLGQCNKAALHMTRSGMAGEGGSCAVFAFTSGLMRSIELKNKARNFEYLCNRYLLTKCTSRMSAFVAPERMPRTCTTPHQSPCKPPNNSSTETEQLWSASPPPLWLFAPTRSPRSRYHVAAPLLACEQVLKAIEAKQRHHLLHLIEHGRQHPHKVITNPTIPAGEAHLQGHLRSGVHYIECARDWKFDTVVCGNPVLYFSMGFPRERPGCSI